MINNNVNNNSFSRADNMRSERGAAKQQAAAAPEAKQSAKAPSTSEQVQLSTGAQQIKSMESKLAKLPDVNEARVAEVKAKLEKGEYSVDTNSLADKILASDLLLNK